RGRSLRAQILQENGNPVTAAMVYLNAEGAGGGIGQMRIPGTFEFDRMARVPAVLTVSLGAQEFTMPVAADDDFVEMRVPNLADLRIALSNSFVAESGARVCVAITALDRAGACDRRYFPSSNPAETPQLWQLPAGRYQLQIEQRQLGRRGVKLIGAARELTVQGGDTFEVVLP